jgi:hypothetical protein
MRVSLVLGAVIAVSACGGTLGELGETGRDGGTDLLGGEAADAGLSDAGPQTGDAAVPDASAPQEDAGVPDAGGGEPDSGQPDSGEPGAGSHDAGPTDAGAPDAGRPDAGLTDAGVPDAGSRDAGLPDAGSRDAGSADAGAPDAGISPADGGSGKGVYGRGAVAAFDALSAADRAAIRDVKVLLHHHSVGENIMGWWTDDTPAGGSNAPGGAARLGFPFSRAGSAAAYAGTVRLGENTGGNNGDGAGKLASFQHFIATQGFGSAVQVAVFKFCYIDFGGGSNLTSMAQVLALEATYRSTMATLQASYPNLRIIHVTPPLKNYWTSEANDLRVEMGRFLRAEYGTTGYVFDLQDLESHGVSGALCARSGVPVICDPYVGGTGHLTDLGADLAAKALLYTVLKVATAP